MARVICCIASGPSLTKSDCDFIEKNKIETIAVNNSWELARFAHHIYAGDGLWWNENIKKIDTNARRWTCIQSTAQHFKLELHNGYRGVENSGKRAIELALDFCADKVILIGYDCSLKNGIHWHGKHKNLCNPEQPRVDRWKEQFAEIKEKEKIVNCSRYTELTAFRISTLERELCGQK